MRLGLFGSAAPRVARALAPAPQITQRDLPPVMPPAWLVERAQAQGFDPMLALKAMQEEPANAPMAPAPVVSSVPPMGMFGGAAKRAMQSAPIIPQQASAAPVNPDKGAMKQRGMMMQGPQPPQVKGGMQAAAQDAGMRQGAFMQGPKPPTPAYESNPLLDTFGYDPQKEGMGGLEWWFSPPARRDEARGERAGAIAAEQAKAERARQRAEVVQLFGPQAGVAFDTNPEKFGEFVGSNYEAANVAGGESRVFGNGRETFTAPKFGVDGGFGYTQGPDGIDWGTQRGATHSETETGRHNLATEGIQRSAVDVSRQRAATAAATPRGGLTENQALQFQFKLDDLDRDLAANEERRRASLSTVTTSIALLDDFLSPQNKPKFEATYGNMINPTGEGDDAFNWRVSAATDPNRADGMAMLEQIGGRAFLNSIAAMRGTGALSDREGAKVGAAATRLAQPNQSDESASKAGIEFRAALLSYQKALEQDIARNRAAEVQRRQQIQGMMGTQPVQQAAPSAADASDDDLRAILGLE